jgi:hypothetical protein
VKVIHERVSGGKVRFPEEGVANDGRFHLAKEGFGVGEAMKAGERVACSVV